MDGTYDLFWVVSGLAVGGYTIKNGMIFDVWGIASYNIHGGPVVGQEGSLERMKYGNGYYKLKKVK